MLSAMVADVVGQAVLGGGRFLSGFPAGVALQHPRDCLLVGALAVIAALVGIGFKTVLYRTEDLCDRVWKDRPEWARPAVGGVALGLLLLALPQMYGVGYPVMYKAVSGGYVPCSASTRSVTPPRCTGESGTCPENWRCIRG